MQVCWGRRYNVSAFLYVFPSSNTHDTCDMAFLFSQWLEYVPPYAHQPNALCHLSSSNLAMIVGIPDQNRTYMSLLLQTPPHLKQGNKKCCFHVLSLTANTFLYVHKTFFLMWSNITCIFFFSFHTTNQTGRPPSTQSFLCIYKCRTI